MTWFPKGMRRRWWLFRPIDALAALWPARGPKKGVLVVRMDGIGDMVMFRRALDFYPQALGVAKDEITVLGCHSWRALAEDVFAGYRVATIDEHAFEKKALYRLKVALWLRRKNFRVAVCDMFHRKAMTADSLVMISGAEERLVCRPFITARTRAEFAWYLERMTRVIDTGAYPTHETLRHFTFLSLLTGSPHPPESPRIPWREQVPAVAAGGRYVVMNFGSNEPGRRWPFAHFLDLAQRFRSLGLRVVFVGARQEAFAKPYLAQQGDPGMVDTIGDLSLAQLVDVLKHARLVVTNDTGPGHLALGVGAPTVLIAGGGHWGCFVPYPEEIRPAGAAFLSVEVACRHCLWRCDRRDDPAAAFPCVAGVTVDDVWAAATSALANS